MIISKRIKQDTNLNNWIKDDYHIIGDRIFDKKIKKQYDYIYVFSASIFDYSLEASAYRQNLIDLLQYAGLKQPVINVTYANRADDINDYLAKLPNIVGDIEGLDNVLVIVHGPGNTVTESGPYPGGKEEAYEGMRTIVDALHDAKADVLMANLSFRKPPASNPTAPYNKFVIEPLIKSRVPEAWDDYLDKPQFDLYSLFFKHQDKLRDGTHPNAALQYLLRNEIAKVISKKYTGVNSLTVDKLQSKSFCFGFANGSEYFQGINPVIVNTDQGTSTEGVLGAASIICCRDTEGNTYPDMSLEAYDFANKNLEGRTIGSVTAPGVDNTEALSTSIYVNDPDNTVATVEITGLPNGLTGTVSINASRNATASDRVGEYWIENYEHNMQTLDAAANPPTPITFNFTVEDNKLSIKWRKQSGSTYAYLGVIKVDFD